MRRGSSLGRWPWRWSSPVRGAGGGGGLGVPTAPSRVSAVSLIRSRGPGCLPLFPLLVRFRLLGMPMLAQRFVCSLLCCAGPRDGSRGRPLAVRESTPSGRFSAMIRRLLSRLFRRWRRARRLRRLSERSAVQSPWWSVGRDVAARGWAVDAVDRVDGHGRARTDTDRRGRLGGVSWVG